MIQSTFEVEPPLFSAVADISGLLSTIVEENTKILLWAPERTTLRQVWPQFLRDYAHMAENRLPNFLSLHSGSYVRMIDNTTLPRPREYFPNLIICGVTSIVQFQEARRAIQSLNNGQVFEVVTFLVNEDGTHKRLEAEELFAVK